MTNFENTVHLRSATSSLVRLLRLLDRFWLVVALTVGFSAALIPTVAALPGAVLLALFISGIFAVSLYGIGGTLALVPAIASMTLLKRFDTQMGIPLGRFTLPPPYWLTILAFLGCLMVLFVQKSTGKKIPQTREEKRFLGRFWVLWVLFTVLGVLSSLYNACFDLYLTDRSILGEMLALGMIVVPMGFVGLLPILGLRERQTKLAIATLVAFLTATAFLMAFFALAPGRIVAALGITQKLDTARGMVRGWTPLGASNSLAALLVLVLPITLIMGVREKSFLWKLYYLSCFGVLVLGLMFSQSRSGVAVALMVFLLSWFYVVKAKGPGHVLRVVVSLFLAGVVAVGVGILLLTFDFSRFWARDFYGDTSIERRWESMTTAMSVFWDHPLLGVSSNALYTREDLDPDWVPEGIDLVSTLVYYRGMPSAPHPHNLPLTLLAEFGLLGTIVMCGIGLLLANFFVRSYVALKKCSSNVWRDYLFCFTLGLTGFLLASLGGALFLYSIRIGVVFWTLVGLMLRYVFLCRANALRSHFRDV